MKLKTFYRIFKQCDKKVLTKLTVNMCFRSMMNLNRFKKRMADNLPYFPAFLAISLTNRCNLSCIGCWVTTDTDKPVELSSEQLENIIKISRKNGSYFFALLGGEPLLYPQLFEIIAKYPDCYFQLFTNGMLLDKQTAAKMRALGNITPLISIEGLTAETKIRRGSSKAFENSVKAIENCAAAKLLTGVSASICATNYNELVSEKYIKFLINKGVHYLWYYIYRPVGAKPAPELALTEDHILNLRQFIVDGRKKQDIIIIDAYWDADGNALCPAASGISHHIGPTGALEFCPPLQFAKDYLNSDASNLEMLMNNSVFLNDLRKTAAAQGRGCIILENPEILLKFMQEKNADNTSLRNNEFEELEKMRKLAGHNIPGKEIPETNLLYKLAKKKYFFGFGAYG